MNSLEGSKSLLDLLTEVHNATVSLQVSCMTLFIDMIQSIKAWGITIDILLEIRSTKHSANRNDMFYALFKKAYYKIMWSGDTIAKSRSHNTKSASFTQLSTVQKICLFFGSTRSYVRDTFWKEYKLWLSYIINVYNRVDIINSGYLHVNILQFFGFGQYFW